MRFPLLIAPLLFMPSVLAAQTAPAPAAGGTAAPAPTAPGAVVQCRRYPVTGSLAQTRRICRTVAEWNRQSREGNEAARDMVGLGANPDHANPPGGG